MRTQQQDAPTRLVTISGAVNASGAIQSGTGFTVTKGGVGAYTIYFTPALRALVAWVAATYGSAGFVILISSTARSVALNTNSYTGAGADVGFQFTAAGLAL